MCHLWPQNGPFVLTETFLVQTIIITFIYLLADPESLGCAISRPKMVHSLQTKNVLEKLFNIIFIHLLATFIVQNAKKNSYNGSRVMRMCHLWVQNGPFAQMRIFSENLLISPVLIYMPKIKVRFSSVNEILTIKEC